MRRRASCIGTILLAIAATSFPPARRSSAQVAPACDPARYPTWLKWAAGPLPRRLPASPMPLGWEGLDLSQLPADVTSSSIFQDWWQDFYERTYPLGYVPSGARLAAWRQVRAMDAVQTATGGEHWVNLGPVPEVGEFPGGNSGRVTDIAVSPAQPNEWLIATAGGGIWKTVDSGATFVPTSDDQPALAMGAIAYARSDPTVVYAATGDFTALSGRGLGVGLLKSVNGGSSWECLPSGSVGNECPGSDLPDHLLVHDIRVHPTNPQSLVVSTSGGIFVSTDGGIGWSPATFHGASAVPFTSGGFATTLEIKAPTPGNDNFSFQYAGIKSAPNASDRGVYRSVDGGRNWSQVGSPYKRAD